MEDSTKKAPGQYRGRRVLNEAALTRFIPATEAADQPSRYLRAILDAYKQAVLQAGGDLSAGDLAVAALADFLADVGSEDVPNVATAFRFAIQVFHSYQSR